MVALALLAAGCSGKATLPAVRDGDIIFHTSRSAQSMAIQRATGSKYSHLGMVVHRNGQPFVLEAISTVQFTPLERWIARGADGHFVVKRLRNADAVLTPAALKKLRSAAQPFLGRRYDLTFDWSDQRIYCSELVWKAYERAFGLKIGALQKVRDFNLSDPAVRTKMQERYGNDIPLDEPVISPSAMFQSPLLVTVAERCRASAQGAQIAPNCHHDFPARIRSWWAVRHAQDRPVELGTARDDKQVEMTGKSR